MNTWLFPALTALINFGLWGFFAKCTVNHIDSKSAFFYQTLGAALIGLIGLCLFGLKPALDARGISYGLLTGATYSLGCLFFFFAVNRGSITTIVTLTALYPLVTILLSYFILHEAISLRQFLGITFAVVAMYLFAG